MPSFLDDNDFESRVAKEIWLVATLIEGHGNHGMYIRGVDVWKIDKQYRDGILFYLRWNGWHVHKNPHWRDMFAKRFPTIYAQMTGSE